MPATIVIRMGRSKMKRYLLILSFLSAIVAHAQRQEFARVSYLNDQSVYLKFEDTRGIKEGDTLYDASSNAACLQIQKVSSISVLAKRIANCEIELKQRFFVRLSADEEPPEMTEPVSPNTPQISENSADSLQGKPNQSSSRPRQAEKGFLNLALSSAATLSTNGRNNYRSVARASLGLDSLWGQDLSLEVYGNAQNFNRNYESTGDDFRANIYNAALVYRPIKNQEFVLGRRLNRRVASLGAIDGLQWEGHWGNWTSGVIAGSRPDFENYGFNLNLMQYGAYGAYDWSNTQTKQRGQLSLGLMEQRNGAGIDRRYLYTQQSLRWGKLYAFTSAEIDLYENFDTAQAANTARLSSLYLSLRYRLNSRWTVFASYDNRQQIIFFERFDSEVERLLSEQGAREGYRFRTNYRFFKSTHLGLSYNLRTNPTYGNNAENLQASLSQHNLPWLGGSISYRFNLNRNGNLNSEINSIRYARNFRSGSRLSAYYRYVSFQYALREITLDAQHYYGIEYSQALRNDWNLGLMAEYSMIHQQDQLRIFLRLNKRLKF